MAKKKPKTPKQHPDQTYIPGTEPVRNERVFRAARLYEREMKARVAASDKETEAHTKLLDVMEEEGVDIYEDPTGMMATITVAKKKVKVSHKADKPPAADDGDEPEE